MVARRLDVFFQTITRFSLYESRYGIVAEYYFIFFVLVEWSGKYSMFLFSKQWKLKVRAGIFVLSYLTSKGNSDHSLSSQNVFCVLSLTAVNIITDQLLTALEGFENKCSSLSTFKNCIKIISTHHIHFYFKTILYFQNSETDSSSLYCTIHFLQLQI